MRFKAIKLEVADKYSTALDGKETQFLFETAIQCLRALKSSPSVMTKTHHNELRLIYDKLDLLRGNIGMSEFMRPDPDS
jgi:hypothetical protein